MYCPYCSSQVKAALAGRKDFPIAGGVLLIIATSVCVVAGIVALGIFFATYPYSYHGNWGYYYNPRYEDLFIGSFGIIAFVYGLGGGILSLKRTKLEHGVRGASLNLIEGFLIILAFARQWPSSWLTGVSFGIPIIILAGTALLFISISK